MIRGIYSSYAGMRTQLLRQDVVAANLANAGSTGYKQDFTVVQSFPPRELVRLEGGSGTDRSPQTTPVGDGRGGSMVASVHTDFSQGNLRETGLPTDLALEGEGFFAVLSEGGVIYTRAGNFHLDAQGRLVTSEGLPVLGEDGNPLQVSGGEMSFLEDGTLVVDGREAGRLLIVAFDDLQSLERLGDGFYRGQGGRRATSFSLRQGYLEASNVDAVEQMVLMIEVFRAYESNQRLIQAQDRTLDKLINQVGKV